MLTEENLAQVRALNEIAAARGQSLAQLALAWTLRDPRVTSTLIGASSVAQLEDNVAALGNLEFSADELADDRPARHRCRHQPLGPVVGRLIRRRPAPFACRGEATYARPANTVGREPMADDERGELVRSYLDGSRSAGGCSSRG